MYFILSLNVAYIGQNEENPLYLRLLITYKFRYMLYLKIYIPKISKVLNWNGLYWSGRGSAYGCSAPFSKKSPL